MSPFCVNCGKENDAAYNVCYHCGAPMGLNGPEALLGKTVLNSYELTDLLGEGGMAVVYKGRNRLTGQEVAVKVLPPELAVYAEVKQRFIDEARTLARLEHPNIVHLINFAEDMGRLCLVMQYAEGRTMEEMIESTGRLKPAEAVRIMLEVLKALGHAHKEGVIHRDIKPSNIIIRPDGSVKVTDFGIAKITRSTKLTQTGQTMGTVRYMSPEQVRGKGIGPSSDLYSLGITLYEAVVGHTPFDGETHFAIMNQHLTADPKPPIEAGARISARLQNAILTVLTKDPAQRFEDAEAMTRAMARCPEASAAKRIESSQAMAAVSDDRKKTASAEVPSTSGHKILILVVVSAAAVLAGAVLFFFLRPTGTKDAKTKHEEKTPPRTRPGSNHLELAVQRWRTGMHPKLKAVNQMVNWATNESFDKPLYLKVLSQVKMDPSVVERIYKRCLALYPKLLASERVGDPVQPRPLMVAVLEVDVMGNKALWGTDAEADVRYFPLPVATLFLAHQKDFERSALIFGIASHLCPARLPGSECKRLGDLFEKYYAAQPSE